MQTLISPAASLSRQTPTQPLKMIAIGDSTVYGFGDFEGGGWVERLRRNWMSPNSPGHVLYNLGVRGDGVKQVCDRLENEFRLRGELKNRVPDVIILSVGINDSARLGHINGRNYTEYETYKLEMAHLLDLAKKLCPVLFVGMVPVDEEKMPFLKSFYYSHAEQYRYNEATKLACQARQIPHLDIFELWRNRGKNWCKNHLTEDGLHPNVSGYQALLQDVLSWEPVAKLSRK